MYPKARYAGELLEIKRIFDRQGATTEVAVLIETPEAVLHVEELAACPMVSCLMFGPGDLAMETGISLIDGRMPFTEGMLYARSKTLLAARAYGLEAVEGIFVSDLKDLEAVRQSARLSKRMGYTGTICFYPPWIPVINEVRTPSSEEIDWSKRVVDAYEAGLEKGHAAIAIDGKWLTIHQYKLAKGELELAHALGLA
jgi:citrate lyase subunit beta/citryl-CoA lyase